MQTNKTDIAQDGYLAVIPPPEVAPNDYRARIPGSLVVSPFLVHSIKFALEASPL